MNQLQLNSIAHKAFNEIEADALIVLHNAEYGVRVIPFWECSYSYKSAEDMQIAVESQMLHELIIFTDTSSGESIGTCVIDWEEVVEGVSGVSSEKEAELAGLKERLAGLTKNISVIEIEL